MAENHAGINAAYFAKALWGAGYVPDSGRIALAKRRAKEYGVKWADVVALAPYPMEDDGVEPPPMLISEKAKQAGERIALEREKQRVQISEG